MATGSPARIAALPRPAAELSGQTSGPGDGTGCGEEQLPQERRSGSREGRDGGGGTAAQPGSLTAPGPATPGGLSASPAGRHVRKTLFLREKNPNNQTNPHHPQIGGKI